MNKERKNIIQGVLITVMLALSLGCIVYLTLYSFSNPDMTKTRVFLNNWWIILPPVVSIALLKLLK